jgi:hypothetical protein
MLSKIMSTCPGQQILDRRRAAAIGHVQQVDLGHVLEELAAQMNRRARARRGERILAGIVARQLDQLRHRLGRHARAHDQQVGQRPQHGDRGEILGGIVRQLGVERRRDGVAGHAVEPDRVAVGRRMGDRIGADIAARAALVLDDELLAGELAQLLAGDA